MRSINLIDKRSTPAKTSCLRKISKVCRLFTRTCEVLCSVAERSPEGWDTGSSWIKSDILLSGHPPVKPPDAGGPNLTHYSFERWRVCSTNSQTEYQLSCHHNCSPTKGILQGSLLPAKWAGSTCNLPTASYRRLVQTCKELTHSDTYNLDICRKWLVQK